MYSLNQTHTVVQCVREPSASPLEPVCILAGCTCLWHLTETRLCVEISLITMWRILRTKRTLASRVEIMYFYSIETSIHGFLFSSLGQSPFWKSGASGTPYWELWGSVLKAWRSPKGTILKVLGSLWASFLVTFECPEAPGHAPEGSLCSKDCLAVTFRIREANKILLAQAYSPHLFR